MPSNHNLRKSNLAKVGLKGSQLKLLITVDFSIYIGDGFLVQTSESLIPSFDMTDIF